MFLFQIGITRQLSLIGTKDISSFSMKICSLFSGGKDSTYALHWAVLKGFEVTSLITFLPELEDSWMFQYQNVKFTEFQARSMGFPVKTFETSGEKEEEIEDLRRALLFCNNEGNQGVVTGALLSDYQRMNINMVAGELGMKVFSPLWRKDQEHYMRSLLNEGFKFIITHSASMGFPHHLVGKAVDERDIEEIILASRKYGFNPAFEGGEAETFVVDAPLFRHKLEVKGNVICVSDSCTYSIKEVISE
ncbi:hypothetical protein IC007_1370 [Sulfuracidifex tepidarius]|uniref:Diphthamide synthase domain-containing protein n=2 Tax=Sulfuracidifex tepidarius TaxID=1294262 RepID=A0A510E2X6_9CREN|nr:hypothetical protein IC007_1370 [Sulfuracidifex tepidarius]